MLFSSWRKQFWYPRSAPYCLSQTSDFALDLSLLLVQCRCESTGKCKRKTAVICELCKMRPWTAQGNMEISPIFYPFRTRIGESWLARVKHTYLLVNCGGDDNCNFGTKPKLVSLARSARPPGVLVKPVLLPFGWHPRILQLLTHNHRTGSLYLTKSIFCVKSQKSRIYLERQEVVIRKCWLK